MSALDVLNRDGIAVLREHLSNRQMLEIRQYLKGSACYGAHVKAQSDGVAHWFHDAREKFEVWCHDMQTIVTCPHVWEFALAQVPLARDYLGTTPRLYSINAFWTRPGVNPPIGYLQGWHRDYDDKKFVAIFIYGSDVMIDQDGPHCFRMGTQNGADFGPIKTVFGVAGTAFAADTRGYHMGGKPLRGERLLIWSRWGISNPPASYGGDKLSPVSKDLLGDRYPTDPAMQEMVRLVCR